VQVIARGNAGTSGKTDLLTGADNGSAADAEAT